MRKQTQPLSGFTKQAKDLADVRVNTARGNGYIRVTIGRKQSMVPFCLGKVLNRPYGNRIGVGHPRWVFRVTIGRKKSMGSFRLGKVFDPRTKAAQRGAPATRKRLQRRDGPQ
jgi:hypothetical protein